MDQRAVHWPARSVDIRITEPDCDYHNFAGAVAKALRHMAEQIEAGSGFDAAAGQQELMVENGKIYMGEIGNTPYVTTIPARVLVIEWCGAAVIDPPDDKPEPDEARPTDEELAALTPAERIALED